MCTHLLLRKILIFCGVITALLAGCGGHSGSGTQDNLHGIVTFQQTTAAAATECARVFADSTRFLVSDTAPATPDSTLPPNVAVCTVRNNFVLGSDAVAAPATTGGVTLAYALDDGPVLASTIPGTSGPLAGPGQAKLQRYALLALLNATPGQESEFENFIKLEHIPDVLRNPGFISAQRYRLLYPLTSGVSLYPSTAGVVVPANMILYEFDSYDLAASVAEVVRRLMTGETRSSSSMGPGGHVYFLASPAN